MAKRASSNIVTHRAVAFALVPIAVAWGCIYRTGFYDVEGIDAQIPLRAAGSVAVAHVRSTSVELAWSPASGGLAPQSELHYQVYFSTSLPLGTLDEAHAGTPFGTALVGVTGVTVTGLFPTTRYLFNVVVSDGKGNEAVYMAASATTLDKAPATGAIVVSNVLRYQVDLSWPKATDDSTPQSELVYQAYYSTGTPFDTVSEVQAGTAAGSPAKDIAGMTVTGLAGGTTYSFNVIVTDTDGFSSTYLASSTRTAAIPVVTITAPPVNSYANAANASSFAVSGTCSEEGRTVAVSGAGTAAGTCSSGTWSATVDVRGVPDGVFTLKADLTDSAGNTATQARRDFIKDMTAPTVAVTAPPANSYANAANASSFAVSGTCSEEGRTVAVSGAGTAAGTCSSGTWSATVNVSGAQEGVFTLIADLTDATGQDAKASVSFIKDTVAPAAPIGAASSTTISDRPTFTWAPGGGGAGTFRVKLDDSNLGNGATEVVTPSFTPAYSLPAGTHTAYIQERDAAGNWSTTGATAVTIAVIPKGQCPSCKYARPISVTENSSNDLLDYQVLVVLNPATFDYSHVLVSNGGDLRFAVDGAACSYWIESWDTSGVSKVWVKLPGLRSRETKTMTMYYGDASATPVSDGDSTFILFDDFNGNSLDAMKWVDVSEAPAVIKDQNQMLYCKMAGSNALRGWARSVKQITETNIALHFIGLLESKEASLVAVLGFDGSHGGSYDYPVNGLVFDWSAPSGKFFLDWFLKGGCNELDSRSGKSGDVNRHSFELRYYNQSVEVLENDVVALSATATQSLAAKYIGLASREMYLLNKNSNTYFDDVYVRKHVSPEPSVALRAEASNP